MFNTHQSLIYLKNIFWNIKQFALSDEITNFVFWDQQYKNETTTTAYCFQ